MSVDQTGVIDTISTEPKTSSVYLTIMDHLPWDATHFLILDRKLKTYLHFIESGQVFEQYPTAKGAEITIRVFIKYRPNDSALRTLEDVKTDVAKRGFGFEYMPIPSVGYSADNA